MPRSFVTHPTMPRSFLAIATALVLLASPTMAQTDSLFVVRPDTTARAVDTIFFDEAGWVYRYVPIAIGVVGLQLSEPTSRSTASPAPTSPSSWMASPTRAPARTGWTRPPRG